jgi:hypothetical protein
MGRKRFAIAFTRSAAVVADNGVSGRDGVRNEGVWAKSGCKQIQRAQCVRDESRLWLWRLPAAGCLCSG